MLTRALYRQLLRTARSVDREYGGDAALACRASFGVLVDPKALALGVGSNNNGSSRASLERWAAAAFRSGVRVAAATPDQNDFYTRAAFEAIRFMSLAVPRVPELPRHPSPHAKSDGTQPAATPQPSQTQPGSSSGFVIAVGIVQILMSSDAALHAVLKSAGSTTTTSKAAAAGKDEASGDGELGSGADRALAAAVGELWFPMPILLHEELQLPPPRFLTPRSPVFTYTAQNALASPLARCFFPYLEAAAAAAAASGAAPPPPLLLPLPSELSPEQAVRERLPSTTRTVTDGLVEVECRVTFTGRTSVSDPLGDEDEDDADVTTTSGSKQQQQQQATRNAFSYVIIIRNLHDAKRTPNPRSFRVMSRHWAFVDVSGGGHIHEITGPGVVGDFPLLEPGDSHVYRSGTLQRGDVGFMKGELQCLLLPTAAEVKARSELEKRETVATAAATRSTASGGKKTSRGGATKGKAKKSESVDAAAEPPPFPDGTEVLQVVDARIAATALVASD